jgi:hypothetical protein
MAFDDTTLSQTHTITRLSIQSNTQISAKATNVISKLSATREKDSSNTETNTSAKPPLIILRAQSRWASKLISIIEIAKRNLAESPPPTATTNGSGSSSGNGIEIFQYSSLSSEMVEIERRKPKSKGLGGAPLPEGEGEGEGEGSDDEGAFQTMGASAAAAAADGEDEGGMKKRAVPVLTVYLAGRPVKALRSEFGWVYGFFFSTSLHPLRVGFSWASLLIFFFVVSRRAVEEVVVVRERSEVVARGAWRSCSGE